MPPSRHPLVGPKEGRLQLGRKCAIETIIGGSRNGAVPALPGKGHVSIRIRSSVVESVEGPVHVLDVFVCHPDGQLPVELDVDRIAPDLGCHRLQDAAQPGRWPRLNRRPSLGAEEQGTGCRGKSLHGSRHRSLPPQHRRKGADVSQVVKHHAAGPRREEARHVEFSVVGQLGFVMPGQVH